MIRPIERVLVGVVALNAALAMAACSSSGGHAPPPPATPSTAPSPSPVVSTGANAPVIAAMNRWTAADTPAQACAAVSTGFAIFLCDGAAADCPRHIRSVLGHLQHGTPDITAVTFQRGEAVVTAAVIPVSSRYNRYYFVSEAGQWKLNSIGVRREPLPPASSAADPSTP